MKKNIIIIIGLFILLFIVSSFSYANSVLNDLQSTFFRLHIIANSDSEEDQSLKLKVRDKVIEYVKSITQDVSDKSEIIDIINENMENIKSIAIKEINENGYNYPVEIEIGNFYFPTKIYGNISLPAGNYDAVRIKIGEAKGQNWWCSLFPPLCFINISSGIVDENGAEYLSENLSEDEYSLITTSNLSAKYKFKVVELIEKAKIKMEG